MNSSGGPQVQHEHPWMNTACEGEDESGRRVEYETDEEEFERGTEPGILPGGSRLDTTLTVPATVRKKVTAKRKKKKTTENKKKSAPSTGYSLGYFSLWWSRMEREASKDMKRMKEEWLRHKQEWSLLNMLDIGPKAEVESITIAENVAEKKNAIYGWPQSDRNLTDCDDNLGSKTFHSVGGGGNICSGLKITNTDGVCGGGLLSAEEMISEWTQAFNIKDAIIGQHQGDLHSTVLETDSSEDGPGVTGGQEK